MRKCPNPVRAILLARIEHAIEGVEPGFRRRIVEVVIEKQERYSLYMLWRFGAEAVAIGRGKRDA